MKLLELIQSIKRVFFFNKSISLIVEQICGGVDFVGVVHSTTTIRNEFCTFLWFFSSKITLWVIRISILYLFSVYSEVEQSLASTISDRATDEVIEALTRCRRGLDISDTHTATFENAETPDIVRSRSSQDSMGFIQIRELDLPHRNLDSPTVSGLCFYSDESLTQH